MPAYSKVTDREEPPLLNVAKSVRGRTWRLRCENQDKIQALAGTGQDIVSAQILAGRGVGAGEVETFLKPTLRALLPDPSSLLDMDKAASHIVDAVQAGQAVTIFADYDVDGATSAAQLIRWGRAMGQDFDLYVPDRIREGYGPNRAAFETIKETGAELVITVDCGAAAQDALRAAADLDLPVIVIDHHLMSGEKPPALALVNPNQQGDSSDQGHLSAAGVTFLLLVALNREARKRGLDKVPDLLDYLDLTALGTVCDVVPLNGLNRAYVRQGLKIMSNRPKAGLEALAETASINPPFSTYDLGFVIGPRINAGGRIGHAEMGAKLLSTDDLIQARTLATALDKTNQERRAMQAQMLEEALGLAEMQARKRKTLCVSMPGWHAGILGIVAGRLKDRFGLPAFVIGVEGGLGKGSGRSIRGVNLGEAVQAARASGLLQAGGGHAMAAGLTIEADKIETFHDYLEKALERQVEQALQHAACKIDCVIAAQAVGTELMDLIETIGPYGAEMPEPVFAIADLRITYAERLKGGHVRCAFADASGLRLSGIAFRAEEHGLAEILLSPNPPKVHIAVRLKKNTWKGHTKIDMHVQDLAIATV